MAIRENKKEVVAVERQRIKNMNIGKYSQQPAKKNVQMTIDCGSTETRVLTVNKGNLAKSIVNVVESSYSIIEDTDISSVRSKSSSIYDNLEMIINKDGEMTGGIFKDLHIVKGRLVKDIDVLPERITSDQAKSSQEATYVNIVSNVAINLIMDAVSRGAIMQEYGVDITVGLRADDTSSPKRMEKFKSTLAGKYTVNFVRMNTEVKFSIKENNIYLENESNAVVRYWATTAGEDMEKYRRAVLIDGGGSSVDESFLLDGVIVDKGCYTGQYGGIRMIQGVIEQFANSHEEEVPSSEMIEEALPTGLLQNGNDFIDITDDIKNVKIDYAKRILKDLDMVCQKVEVKSTQLNLILTSGRMFGKSVNENSKVPGLHKFIEKLFKKKNATIVVRNIEEEFALAWGLLFFRVSLEE